MEDTSSNKATKALGMNFLKYSVGCILLSDYLVNLVVNIEIVFVSLKLTVGLRSRPVQ